MRKQKLLLLKGLYVGLSSNLNPCGVGFFYDNRGGSVLKSVTYIHLSRGGGVQRVLKY